MAQYLIIAGTHKAGTTALYDMLSNHPMICKSNYKETRFFLDENYTINFRSVEDYRLGYHLYYKLFSCDLNDGKVYLEATPDYLYSKGTPSRIKQFACEFHHDVKLVFILRNPVERFVSWFYFGKEVGNIPANMKFSEYYITNISDNSDNNAYTAALKKGLYSIYLREFIELFGIENICVIPYSKFKTEPLKVVNEVLHLFKLDPIGENEFVLKKSMETYQVKSRLIFNVLRSLRRIKIYLNNPRINKIIEKRFLKFFKKIEKSNSAPHDKSEIDEQTLNKVKQFYSAERESLSRLLSKSFDW